MGLPTADRPFHDEEQKARKRIAEIEDMMRWDRDSYFRNEPVQQEFRNAVTLVANLEQARRDGTATDFQEPGPADGVPAQTHGPARSAYPRVDANDTNWLFDGGEAEARSIFRRDGEIVPDRAPTAFPDEGVGKGDRLPVSRRELPQSPQAFDSGRADAAASLPVRRQDDPARAFEVEPFERDGVERVTELQGQLDEQGQLIKDRPYAIHELLKERLNIAAQKTGLVVEVHSGGQVAEGEVGRRLKDSGPRHNHGNAGDVDLFETVNGVKRKLDARRPEDRKKMADFIQYSVAAGATGIGFGYMGPSRIHIGGGEEAAWSDTKKDKKLNVPLPWVVAAIEKGKAMRAVAGAISRPGGPIDGYNRSWQNPYDERVSSGFAAGPPHASDPGSNSQALSMMRDMIEKYMLAPGEKNSSPIWPQRATLQKRNR